MQKLKILTALFLLLCSSVVFAATPIPIYTDAQKNITVTTDQPTFIIKLKSNPTTGYDWTQPPEYDSALLKLVNTTFEPPYDPSQTMQKVGAQGYRVWTFTRISQPRTALAIVSNTTIRFTYKRAWEKEAPADIQVFNVTLSASNKQ